MALQPWLCGSVDLTANEINIMKKKLDLISVVLYCSRVLWFTIEIPPAAQFSRTCCTASGRGASERMMEQMTAAATEVEKTSAL